MSARKVNRAPLRRIVETRADPFVGLVEVYECGHERKQPSDIYGPTNAYRRRCRQCQTAAALAMAQQPTPPERGE